MIFLEITERNWCDYVCWAPEGMVVYRVYRDPQLFDFLLPFYSQFFSAIDAGMDKPPPLAKGDKERITEAVATSMKTTVDLAHWSNTSPTDTPPEADFDDEEEEVESPSRKRARVSTD